METILCILSNHAKHNQAPEMKHTIVLVPTLKGFLEISISRKVAEYYYCRICFARQTMH